MDRSSGTDRLLLPLQHRGWRVGKYYFPAYAVYVHDAGRRFCLNARCHRKGKPPRLQDAPAYRRAPVHYWAPQRLGWWMALLFMAGSFCFALGAWAASFPQGIPAPLLSAALQNKIFFIGSLFFTSAAACQLIEAGQALKRTVVRVHTLAMTLRLPERFAHLGFASALAQWIGTLLFNLNTYDALGSGTWQYLDLAVWTPDMVGSVCFLLSSHFAFLEIRYDDATSPLARAIVVINYLGSGAFMLSALLSVALPHADPMLSWSAGLLTFAGAVCFFAAAFLLIPELYET